MKTKLSLFLILYLIFTVILGLYLSQYLHGKTNLLIDMLLLFHCNLMLGYSIEAISIVTTVLPTLLVVTYFGVNIAEDITANCAYLFTRTSKRWIWLLKYYKKTLLSVISLNIILILMNSIVIYLLGFTKVDYLVYYIAVIKLLLVNVTIQYSLILFSNFVSLWLNYAIGYAISFCSYITCITIFYIRLLNDKTFLSYLPFTQTLVTYQNWDEINRNLAIFSIYNTDFSWKQGWFISLGYLALIGIMGIPIIHKKEFIA